MKNLLTEDTKVIMLLCASFEKNSPEKQLSLSEYALIVRWLIEAKKRPVDLLNKENLVEASKYSEIDIKRLDYLIGRGIKLGFALEEWQRNGLSIISRSDKDYPILYKKHLKDKCPPFLFCAGNLSLLNKGGMCIVGSRNVDKEGADFAKKIAKICSNNGISVISGGARGVDQISMDSALESGGVAVGILADNLLKKSLEKKSRQAIADDKLLLISPYNPNAGFNIGAAMGRNKLIYAMADFALVISAEYKKGGTWSGAEEELKRENPIPVFVRMGKNVPEGNERLIDLGAIPLYEPIDDSISLCKLLLNAVIKFKKNKPKNNNELTFA